MELRDAVLRFIDGVWICRTPVVLTWNNGLSLELERGMVYEAGVRYKGVDVATMLDEWLATGSLPPDTSIQLWPS